MKLYRWWILWMLLFGCDRSGGVQPGAFVVPADDRESARQIGERIWTGGILGDGWYVGGSCDEHGCAGGTAYWEPLSDESRALIRAELDRGSGCEGVTGNCIHDNIVLTASCDPNRLPCGGMIATSSLALNEVGRPYCDSTSRRGDSDFTVRVEPGCIVSMESNSEDPSTHVYRITCEPKP